jgi:hypothetical protein
MCNTRSKSNRDLRGPYTKFREEDVASGRSADLDQLLMLCLYLNLPATFFVAPVPVLYSSTMELFNL